MVKIPMMRNDMPTINMRFRFGNLRRPVHHEKIKPSQPRFQETAIENICFSLGFRDDLPEIPTGLQYICVNLKVREELFSFQEKWFPPGADLGVGRAGTDIWRIPVLGIPKRGIGWGFVCLCEPSARGHEGRKKPEEPLHGCCHCDSFPDSKNGGYPAYARLLRDALRVLIRYTAESARGGKVLICGFRSGCLSPYCWLRRDVSVTRREQNVTRLEHASRVHNQDAVYSNNF